jgi:hypothetical protein
LIAVGSDSGRRASVRRRRKAWRASLPIGDVVEDDGDLAAAPVADPGGEEFEATLARIRAEFEAGAFAGGGDAADRLDPPGVKRGDKLGHQTADDIAEAGLALEGGIRLDEAVVFGRAVGAQDQFNEAEALVDAFEEHAIVFVPVAEGGLGFAPFGDVGGDAGDVGDLPRRVPDGKAGVADMAQRPVGGAGDAVFDGDGLPGPQPGRGVGKAGKVVGVDEVAPDREVGDDAVAVGAEDAVERGADAGDGRVIGGADPEDIGRILGEGAEEVFAKRASRAAVWDGRQEDPVDGTRGRADGAERQVEAGRARKGQAAVRQAEGLTLAHAIQKRRNPGRAYQIAERAAEPGCSRADGITGGTVEQQDMLRPPDDRHRERVVEHEVDRAAQRAGPVGDRTQRRCRPVMPMEPGSLGPVSTG